MAIPNLPPRAVDLRALLDGSESDSKTSSDDDDADSLVHDPAEADVQDRRCAVCLKLFKSAAAYAKNKVRHELTKKHKSAAERAHLQEAVLERADPAGVEVINVPDVVAFNSPLPQFAFVYNFVGADRKVLTCEWTPSTSKCKCGAQKWSRHGFAATNIIDTGSIHCINIPRLFCSNCKKNAPYITDDIFKEEATAQALLLPAFRATMNLTKFKHRWITVDAMAMILNWFIECGSSAAVARNYRCAAKQTLAPAFIQDLCVTLLALPAFSAQVFDATNYKSICIDYTYQCVKRVSFRSATRIESTSFRKVAAACGVAVNEQGDLLALRLVPPGEGEQSFEALLSSLPRTATQQVDNVVVDTHKKSKGFIKKWAATRGMLELTVTEDIFHVWRRLHECVPKFHPSRRQLGDQLRSITADIDEGVIKSTEDLRNRFNEVLASITGDSALVVVNTPGALESNAVLSKARSNTTQDATAAAQPPSSVVAGTLTPERLAIIKQVFNRVTGNEEVLQGFLRKNSRSTSICESVNSVTKNHLSRGPRHMSTILMNAHLMIVAIKWKFRKDHKTPSRTRRVVAVPVDASQNAVDFTAVDEEESDVDVTLSEELPRPDNKFARLEFVEQILTSKFKWSSCFDILDNKSAAPDSSVLLGQGIYISPENVDARASQEMLAELSKNVEEDDDLLLGLTAKADCVSAAQPKIRDLLLRAD